MKEIKAFMGRLKLNYCGSFARVHLPKEEIEQDVKTGIPPQSPLSLSTSEEKENWAIGLLLVPLK